MFKAKFVNVGTITGLPQTSNTVISQIRDMCTPLHLCISCGGLFCNPFSQSFFSYGAPQIRPVEEEWSNGH